MGTWFPDWRKGTKEQVRTYDRAVRALHRNSERESRAGIREETERYHRLNGRVNATARPLSRQQQDFMAHDLREAAARVRIGRARRKAKRGRGAR